MICDPAVEAFGSDLDQIVAEILALRDRGDTIIRLLEFYQVRVKVLDELDMLRDKRACLNAYSGRIRLIGAKYVIPVAPIHMAFNGPDGAKDANDKGYFLNDTQQSAAGDSAIVSLLRELGYRTVSPVLLARALERYP